MDLNQNEQYRMQMAGISSAAFGWWREGSPVHPDYDTLPLRDVARLYSKYETLYKEKESRKSPKPSALQVALEETLAWLESEKKSISKGNGSQWSKLQCDEHIDRIREVLVANAPEAADTNQL